MECAWCKEPEGSWYQCTNCSICQNKVHGCHSRHWVTEEDLKNNDFTRECSGWNRIRTNEQLVCSNCVHERREYKTMDGKEVQVDQNGNILQDYPCNCGILCRGYIWECGRIRMSCNECFNACTR